MDLQGTPIPPGHRGTKVTSNAPTQENAGPVVNDSLAAESLQSGGAFSANRDAYPLGVSSKNTTTNVTDTSAAREIPSTGDRHTETQTEGKYPDALGGQAEFPGPHVPESGYVGGSTAAKEDLNIGGGEYPASQKAASSTTFGAGAKAKASGSVPTTTSTSTSTSKPTSSYASTAGSGTGRQTRSATAAQKQQSENAAAGDFPDDPKHNASFNSEIGSKEDPGRLAELKFQRREAETVAGAAAPAQKGTGDSTWYEPLSSDQRV